MSNPQWLLYTLTDNWLSLPLRSHDLEGADDVDNSFFDMNHTEQVLAEKYRAVFNTLLPIMTCFPTIPEQMSY